MAIGDHKSKVDPALDKVAAFLCSPQLSFLCWSFLLAVLYLPTRNSFKRQFSSTEVVSGKIW